LLAEAQSTDDELRLITLAEPCFPSLLPLTASPHCFPSLLPLTASPQGCQALADAAGRLGELSAEASALTAERGGGAARPASGDGGWGGAATARGAAAAMQQRASQWAASALAGERLACVGWEACCDMGLCIERNTVMAL